MPQGKRIIHATLDPADLNKSVTCEQALVGDAKLTLRGADRGVQRLLRSPRARCGPGGARRSRTREAGLAARWMPKLTSTATPAQPLPRAVGAAADGGRRRTRSSPTTPAARATSSRRSGRSTAPHSYIGWGKIDPARLRPRPGDGGQAGLPRQAVHQRLGRRGDRLHRYGLRDRGARAPARSSRSCSTTSAMAIELPIMPVATEKYRATDISGDYAAFARALGGHGERVDRPGEIGPALRRGDRRRPRRAARRWSSSSPSRRRRFLKADRANWRDK